MDYKGQEKENASLFIRGSPMNAFGDDNRSGYEAEFTGAPRGI